MMLNKKWFLLIFFLSTFGLNFIYSGNTWPGNIISDTQKISQYPSAATDSNGTYVVAWHQVTLKSSSHYDYDIIIKSFVNKEWIEEKNITSNLNLPISSPYNDRAFVLPKILYSNNKFYLFFIGGWVYGFTNSLPLIYLSTSYDGINFSFPTVLINSNQLLTADLSNATSYDVRIINNKINIVACLAGKLTIGNIFYRAIYYEGGDLSYPNIETLPLPNQPYYGPSIEIKEGNIYVVLTLADDTGKSQIYYMYKNKNIWSDVEKVSIDIASSWNPRVLMKNRNEIIVLWIDNLNYSSYGRLVKKSKDLSNGTWGPIEDLTPETDLDYERPMQFDLYQDSKENLFIAYTSGMPAWPTATAIFLKVISDNNIFTINIIEDMDKDYNYLVFTNPIVLTENDGIDLKFFWAESDAKNGIEDSCIKYYDFHFGQIPKANPPLDFNVFMDKDKYFLTYSPVVKFFLNLPDNLNNYRFTLEKSWDNVIFYEIIEGDYSKILSYIDAKVNKGSTYYYRTRSRMTFYNTVMFSVYSDVKEITIR